MAEQQPPSDLSQDELREKLAKGETTLEDVDQSLQQEARRQAAERDPDELPISDQVTAGGFGSGQGMGNQRTGQDPDIPPERGEPRTAEKAEDWPQ